MDVIGPIERCRSTLESEGICTPALIPELSVDIELPIPRIEEIVTEASTPQIEEIITEDGILCSILSSLTLREAARTSVLSSRWRPIWTHLTKLVFNAITVLDAHDLNVLHLDGKEAYNLLKGKTPQFIQSVNSILRQLQGARVDEFGVRYFLNKCHSHHLDEWIRFAVASNAKTFRLHLFKDYSSSPVERYEFPCQLLESSSSIVTLSLIFCSLKLPFKFDGLKSLERLGLVNVDVNEEDFHCILSNCSSTLTKLCLWEAPRWVSISIPHPLNQLQTLLVRYCDQLRKIEINAINLEKLIYYGFPVDFKFRQSTKLNDANICFKKRGTAHSLDFYLTKLSSGLPHLHYLSLKITGVSKEAYDLPNNSNRFNHLTHLDWEWDVGLEMSILHLSSLLVAAPFLENLKLRLSVLEEPPQTPSKVREMLPKRPHAYLKAIVISGFYFERWQNEIAIYLLNNATKLESMTIEKGSKPSQFVSEKIQETGMKNLCLEVPAGVRFVIL